MCKSSGVPNRLFGIQLTFFVILLSIILQLSAFAAEGKADLQITIKKLSSEKAQLSSFDRMLLELNIGRAYHRHETMQNYPFFYDKSENRFKTHYYISNSDLLKLPANELINKLEVTVNGDCMAVSSALGDISFFAKIRLHLDIEFVIFENGSVYRVARFRDGRLDLSREKIQTP